MHPGLEFSKIYTTVPVDVDRFTQPAPTAKVHRRLHAIG
jgi:hypothetical protein